MNRCAALGWRAGAMLLAASAGLLGNGVAAAACDPAPVERILVRLGDIAGTADAGARRAGIAGLLRQRSDDARLGRLALGPRWRTYRAADRRRIGAAVARLAVARGALRLGNQGLTRSRILEARTIAGGDCLVAARVESRTGGSTIVHWRMDGDRFVDILVDGVSLARGLRDEIAAIGDATGGDADALIARLDAAAARAGNR